jgi:hypothetical protein
VLDPAHGKSGKHAVELGYPYRAVVLRSPFFNLPQICDRHRGARQA